MSTRRHRKAMERWEDATRAWGERAARDLVLAICTGARPIAHHYQLGVVLQTYEQPWLEFPATFPDEIPPGLRNCEPPVRPWLVTSNRIVGRIGDDRLYSAPWDDVAGCVINLEPPGEGVALDLASGGRPIWIGPGVTPLAVAAVARLYGVDALLDHPEIVRLHERSREVVRNG